MQMSLQRAGAGVNPAANNALNGPLRAQSKGDRVFCDAAAALLPGAMSVA